MEQLDLYALLWVHYLGKTVDPCEIQNQEGIPDNTVCRVDVLAGNRVDKPPPCADAIPCHSPKLCRNVLGYILEFKSKIKDIDQRLGKFKGASQITSSVCCTINNHPSVSTSPLRYNGARLLGFVPRAVSSQDQGVFDSELHSVLQLATGSELYEVERILFGTSYFSPLLKSIAKPSNIDYVMIEEDPEEREEFISILEARFFFLAADARSSLRGWRPTYRNVLLGVRKELKIPCSTKLSTEDLEIEIFLHLLQEYSSEGSGSLKRGSDSLEVGLSPWKVQAFAALGRGAEEFITMVLKGGGMFTVGRLYNLISSKLSGKVFLEAANYQIKKEVLKEGGRLAAINLESRAALLAAKQGLKGAASRYLGVRSIMVLLGPMLWGTFLADLVIQMLGTDYARILRAIYAFAQIRISRTYRLPSDSS